MTVIVAVASHEEGVVRVYHRHPDGALTQTARFVAAAVDPPILAALIADLSDTLHWNGTAVPEPIPTPPPVPIGKGKTKPNGDFRKRSRAGQAETARRRDDVLTYLATHREATAPQIGTALFAHLPDPIGKARKTLDQLVDRKLITRVPSKKHGTPMRFRQGRS